MPYIKTNPPQVYTCSPSWTLLPPPSPYHPSGLSQCTSPKHPVSCIEPGLAPHFIYDIIHVSVPFSQIIPPSPSPTESKRLFYTSVSRKMVTITLYTRQHSHVLKWCDHLHFWKIKLTLFLKIVVRTIPASRLLHITINMKCRSLLWNVKSMSIP